VPLAKHFIAGGELPRSEIEQGIKLMQINEYLRSELVRAGFAGVDIQKTPLGVRITLRTSRPGLVIGKLKLSFRHLSQKAVSVFKRLRMYYRNVLG